VRAFYLTACSTNELFQPIDNDTTLVSLHNQKTTDKDTVENDGDTSLKRKRSDTTIGKDEGHDKRKVSLHMI
jgi:hypothetical protein